jgi:hypothetical protein
MRVHLQAFLTESLDALQDSALILDRQHRDVLSLVALHFIVAVTFVVVVTLASLLIAHLRLSQNQHVAIPFCEAHERK